MIETFDAFISYKHAPLDNKIAEEVQRSLEHFHIPSKLKEKLNKKKIERIFRDKSELPITSSLSDNISYALEHSDFLIVICSHSTKLSGWVPREIEYFLKFHPISNVLTVLAEGEPEEVIPKQLLETTVIKKDELGEVLYDMNNEPQTETVELEPLSCDYRLPLRTARRKELPRLAAAILGCSYDELVMRARQYRRRRNAIIITAALVAAAVAIGYLLWSRQQIQKNYEQAQENLRQSLINQSVYLANASDRVRLQDHDGVGAALLALEALPKEGEERPVVPEAISALSEAVNAYTVEGGSSDFAVPIKKYSMNSNVKDMALSEDNKTLFLVNDAGETAAFDVESQEKLFAVSFTKGYFDRMSVLPVANDRLLISDGSLLHYYDWQKNSELWNLPLFRDENGKDLVEILMGHDSLQILQNGGIAWDDPNPPVAMSLSPDGKTLALDGANDVIRFIDLESGTETKRICAGISKLAELLDQLNSEETYFENEIQKLIWSPDGSRLAAVYLNGMTDDYTVSVLVYDFKEEVWFQFDTNETNWEDLCFAGNDDIVLITIGGIDELLNSQISNTYNQVTRYIKSTCTARCFSLSQKNLRWQADLTWDIPWEKPGAVLYLDKDTYGREAVFVCIANAAYILDMEDGSIINSNVFKSTISGEISADQSYVGFYMTNGRASWLYDENISDDSMAAYYESPRILETDTPITFAQITIADDPEDETFSYLLCRQKNCPYVLGFGTGVDPDGTLLSGKTFPKKPKGTAVMEEVLIVYEEDKISGLNIETGELLFEIERDDSLIEMTFATNEDGTGTDQIGLLLNKDNEYSCMLLNIYDGSTEILPIHEKILACQNGYFYWISKEENSFGAFERYCIKDQSTERIPISGPENDSIINYSGFHFAEGPHVLCQKSFDSFEERTQIYLIDLETGEMKPVSKIGGYTFSYLLSDDNNCFVIDANGKITIYSMDGEILSEIGTQGRQIINMHLIDGYLYVYYNNGKLFRYRIENGTETGVINDSLALNSQTQASGIYRDGKLFLITDNDSVQFGSTLTTIDLESMGVLNRIEDNCGYSIKSKRYIVWGKNEDTSDYVFYSFPVYTVDELIQKGKDLIGGNEISAEMRAQYGLSLK